MHIRTQRDYSNYLNFPMIYDVCSWHSWLFICPPSVTSQSKEGRNRCGNTMFEQRVRCIQRQYKLDRWVLKDLKVRKLAEASFQSGVKETQRAFPYCLSTLNHFLTLEDVFCSFKCFSRVYFTLWIVKFFTMCHLQLFITLKSKISFVGENPLQTQHLQQVGQILFSATVCNPHP